MLHFEADEAHDRLLVLQQDRDRDSVTYGQYFQQGYLQFGDDLSKWTTVGYVPDALQKQYDTQYKAAQKAREKYLQDRLDAINEARANIAASTAINGAIAASDQMRREWEHEQELADVGHLISAPGQLAQGAITGENVRRGRELVPRLAPRTAEGLAVGSFVGLHLTTEQVVATPDNHAALPHTDHPLRFVDANRNEIENVNVERDVLNWLNALDTRREVRSQPVLAAA